VGVVFFFCMKVSPHWEKNLLPPPYDGCVRPLPPNETPDVETLSSASPCREQLSLFLISTNVGGCLSAFFHSLHQVLARPRYVYDLPTRYSHHAQGKMFSILVRIPPDDGSISPTFKSPQFPGPPVLGGFFAELLSARILFAHLPSAGSVLPRFFSLFLTIS